MQDIRLLRMSIRNFKGIRELDIDFAGKDMNVLGDNGTGKTTIIDSFTWLLFGKDSLGRADFGIKPTDKAGNIIHQLETSVEAVFDISGASKVFKKTLEEVWTRKRGAAEAEFTRNENNFYIDGVPKKKMEYTAAIKELIDEEVFKIITNPLYFNESVKWQDRRSVLLTICGEVSDADVIAANEGLAPLLPLLQGKTVSDFKDIAAASMKRINRELDMIPVQISEADRAKPCSEALDVDLARKDELTKQIEALRVKKSNVTNGSEVNQLWHKVNILTQDLRVVGRNYNPNNSPIAAELSGLASKRDSIALEIKGASMHKDLLTSQITQKKGVRAKFSTEWDEIFAERFTDSVCPTCHRELPEDEVEERRKEFNRKKAAKLDEVERKNTVITQEIQTLEEQLKADESKIVNLSEELSRTEAAADALTEKLNEEVKRKSAEFEQERTRIQTEIDEAKTLIAAYEERTEEAVAEINRQIASLSAELSGIDTVIANRLLLERQDKRIAELREQQKHLAAEYAAAERSLYLAERFIVAKVNMLNERINQKFKYAKFKLFDQQINGGINEVCEVTYQGIPYKDLNNAMRINIGLDVINTIAAHYGVACPILIDNAESVNELFHTDAQQIRFYVSRDKYLRMEMV